MKVNIVSISNSKGLRIPKSALDQCNFHKEADIEVENNKRQFNNEVQHLGQQECTQEDLVSKLVNDIKGAKSVKSQTTIEESKETGALPAGARCASR